MKQLLFLILLFIINSNTVYADGKFIFTSYTNSSIEMIRDNVLLTNFPAYKFTYDAISNYTIITGSNGISRILLSGNTSIQINPNTRLSINSFKQNIVNIDSYPEEIIPATTNLTLSLIGSIDVIFTKSNSFTIGTYLANLELNKGRFSIKSDESSLFLTILEGNAIAYDNSSTTKYPVLENKMMISTIPPIPQKRGEIKRKNLFYIKSLDSSEISDYKLGFTSMDIDLLRYKFIVVYRNVYGVYIK